MVINVFGCVIIAYIVKAFAIPPEAKGEKLNDRAKNKETAPGSREQ